MFTEWINLLADTSLLAYLITSNATVIQHKKNADCKWPFLNPANIHFWISFLCRGRKMAVEIPTSLFPVRNSKWPKPLLYSLETCCHYDIWLPTLHMAGYKNLYFQLRETTVSSFEESLCLSVSLSLSPPLSLQTKSSNWVLWGSELPWALCCGCLIGPVIHKQAMVYCTALVVEGYDYCLSTFPRRADGNIYTDCNFVTYSMHITLGCVSLIGTVSSTQLINFFVVM